MAAPVAGWYLQHAGVHAGVGRFVGDVKRGTGIGEWVSLLVGELDPQQRLGCASDAPRGAIITRAAAAPAGRFAKIQNVL